MKLGVVDTAVLAASAGDLSLMGKLYNKAETRQQKGSILGLLAVEYVLREPGQPDRLPTALHILKMARSLLVDEYKLLCTCLSQESITRRAASDTEFAHDIIIGRAEAVKSKYRYLKE